MLSFFGMEIDLILENWALWASLVPGTLVVYAVAVALYRRSGSGQLSRACRNHRAAQKTLARARESVTAAAAKVGKLQSRADKVRPRELQEAKDALEDCRALEKIADDKSQVMRNHLRRVIFEEFPPARHEKMRARYLPQDVEDGRPFTF